MVKICYYKIKKYIYYFILDKKITMFVLKKKNDVHKSLTSILSYTKKYNIINYCIDIHEINIIK